MPPRSRDVFVPYGSAESRVLNAAALRRADEHRARREALMRARQHREEAREDRLMSGIAHLVHEHHAIAGDDGWETCNCGARRRAYRRVPDGVIYRYSEWESPNAPPIPIAPHVHSAEETTAMFDICACGVRRRVFRDEHSNIQGYGPWVNVVHEGRPRTRIDEDTSAGIHSHYTYMTVVNGNERIEYCSCGAHHLAGSNTWMWPAPLHVHRPTSTNGFYEYCNCRARKPVWWDAQGTRFDGNWGDFHPYVLLSHEHTVERREDTDDVCACGARRSRLSMSPEWITPPWVQEEYQAIMASETPEERHDRFVRRVEARHAAQDEQRHSAHITGLTAYERSELSAWLDQHTGDRVRTSFYMEPDSRERFDDELALVVAMSRYTQLFDGMFELDINALYKRYLSWDVTLAVLKVMKECQCTSGEAEGFLSTNVTRLSGGKYQLVFSEEGVLMQYYKEHGLVEPIPTQGEVRSIAEHAGEPEPGFLND